MKAFGPSAKSSVDASFIIPSPERFQPSASGASTVSSAILRLSRTASGCVGGDAVGQGAGPLERLAGLAQLVDQSELGGPLGRDRVAGHDDLERDLAGQHARETEQPARSGDE